MHEVSGQTWRQGDTPAWTAEDDALPITGMPVGHQLLNIEVACPQCGAKPGHMCVEGGEDMGFQVHNERGTARRRTEDRQARASALLAERTAARDRSRATCP